MEISFSRQQSLFHVLAAYSIYNTVSWSTPAHSFLSCALSTWRRSLGLPPDKALLACIASSQG